MQYAKKQGCSSAFNFIVQCASQAGFMFFLTNNPLHSRYMRKMVMVQGALLL